MLRGQKIEMDNGKGWNERGIEKKKETRKKKTT